MKLSMNWLKSLVPYDYDVKKYVADMTMSGSKVETAEYMGQEIRGVVVGLVREIERHPDSDHLWVCQVDVGQEAAVQIVTGAQNVKAGDFVPAALHDSYLPGDIHIKKGKLRGLPSEGMLCSFQEFGMTIHEVPGACEDGILILNGMEGVEIGRDIRQVLGFDDWVIDFEITPNRPDCLSMIGLARESAVTYGMKYVPAIPQVKGGGGDIAAHLKVRVEDRDLCPRYMARVVRDVKIAPSPKWLRDRLRACGVRPINNIVDITNYVMLEYGQPMHGFDYSCLEGGEIVVRRARAGEITHTLDGQERSLDADMLVIADSKKAVGIAGIMGGANSEIAEDTKTVVFESATFDGTSIRLSSRHLGMRTESSGRFEKGLDPNNAAPALERACELVELLGAGVVCDGVIDVNHSAKLEVRIPIEPERINRFIGVEIPRENMLRWFDLLGFAVEGETVVVPSWRQDVEQFADIAEEVARFYGYDNIPTTLYSGEARYMKTPEITFSDRVRDIFCALGYSEAQTFSLVGPKSMDRILLPQDSPLRAAVGIQNPLSEDMSCMRTTMLPSILEVAARNANMKNEMLRVYELGRVYPVEAGEKLPRERGRICAAIYGEADFFQMKGAIEVLADSLGLPRLRFTPQQENPSFHPGRCAEVYCGEDCLGVFGQVHPAVLDNFNTSAQIFAMELELEVLRRHADDTVVYEPLAKYPAISRDLAIVCAEAVPAAQIEDCIREGAGTLLETVRLFDVYRSAQLGEGQKSLAYAFTLRDKTRSLADEDADRVVKRILKLLETKVGASLRS